MTILDFNTAKKQNELTRVLVDIEDIRDRLNANPEAFIGWLFSGRAYISRGQARIGSVQGEAGNSLAIDLKTGEWFDHATGEGGDLIELYREWAGYAGNADFITSLKEIARDYLGDPVEVDNRKVEPKARIAEQKVKLGTKPRDENLELGAPVANYKYYDLHGKIIASVVRFEPDGTRASKTFRPWSFRDGKWSPCAPDLRPLYKQPQIAGATRVVLCEGEGCADALDRIGVPATSAMQGSNTLLDKTDWTPLAGKTVIIWPDHDEPGYKYAEAVAPMLAAIGCTVLKVTPPEDKPPKWDAADCVAEGGNLPHELIAAATPVWDSRPKDPETGKALPLILTSAQFVAGFTPPNYLIDGIIQLGYLYALTARTGHGKTAVDMYMSGRIARGLSFHGAPVRRGTVLFLAGENPDDIRARHIVLADAEGYSAETIAIRYIAGVVDIKASMPIIRAAAEEIKDLVLIIVDTAAAYFKGDDSNSNTQQGEYARMLRQLTFLPGKPAVVVNCHPIKNAAKDNLLPMGGSAFLNEIDGNLTLWANTEKQTTLHWQGKFRGPEFEPLTFEMKTVESPRVIDSNGKKMPSVMAEPVSETKMQLAETAQVNNEITLLGFIARFPNASLFDLAAKCGFISAKNQVMKTKAERAAKRLERDKLVKKVLGKYRITNEGKKEIGWNEGD